MSCKTPHIMSINQKLNKIINEWEKKFDIHIKKYTKTK